MSTTVLDSTEQWKELYSKAHIHTTLMLAVCYMCCICHPFMYSVFAVLVVDSTVSCRHAVHASLTLQHALFVEVP